MLVLKHDPWHTCTCKSRTPHCRLWIEEVWSHGCATATTTRSSCNETCTTYKQNIRRTCSITINVVMFSMNDHCMFRLLGHLHPSSGATLKTTRVVSITECLERVDRDDEVQCLPTLHSQVTFHLCHVLVEARYLIACVIDCICVFRPDLIQQKKKQIQMFARYIEIRFNKMEGSVRDVSH